MYVDFTVNHKGPSRIRLVNPEVLGLGMILRYSF